ncbi:MAG: two pore domain potassium channel family protein [Gammaproteobacteria bacterium]|nr:MAG: two pore domain potassium channel family protein [Gammaproteobacteria bacterium]
MILNLALGIGLMLITLFFQLHVLVLSLQWLQNHPLKTPASALVAGYYRLGTVMLILLLGNLLQIALWALLFQLLGEFEHFADAFYHSTVNFATLGYGDIVLSKPHRLLGALEAVNGILMIGITSAAVVKALGLLLTPPERD